MQEDQERLLMLHTAQLQHEHNEYGCMQSKLKLTGEPQ